MSYKSRIIENKIVELFKYYPVVAVLGARQTGKSTLIEHIFKNKVNTVVFDPVVDIGNARSDPDFFLQNTDLPVFFDEVQYAPELLNSIKRKVDTVKQKGLFLLSGSQNLSVLRSISESLAGRVAIVNLLPMTRREILGMKLSGFLHDWIDGYGYDSKTYSTEKQDSVFHYIWRGGYPGILDFPDHLLPGYWESYLQTYIERDVRVVANIGSLQTFGSFFGLLSSLSSHEINSNELGRELGINRKTALAWAQVAEATFQWFSIPAFSRNPIKKIAGKNKGYFSDTGFTCYLQKISAPEVLRVHPLAGRLFETYVVMEILKSVQAWDVKPAFYHFRAYSGAEIDLVLDMNRKLFPIEIKMKSNPGKGDIKSFESLAQTFPKENIHTGLMICFIEKAQFITENVFAIPWWEVV